MHKALLTITATALLAMVSIAGAQETQKTRIGELKFESGYPSEETTATLYDEMDFQRACQAYLWGIPVVGILEWKDGLSWRWRRALA
jgi:hypothetical protein